MAESMSRLKERLNDVSRLQQALAVLGWDQQVYMPPGGAESRAEQIGTLDRMAHEMLIADETGELIEAARSELNGSAPDSDEASLIRVVNRDYEQSKKIPAELVREMSQHAVLAQQAWVKARAENDFAAFAPYLSKTIDLSRRVADYLGYEGERYDALLDLFEPGMKTAHVAAIFADLKAELVPLVAAIAERADRVSDAVVHQSFDEAKQEEFGKAMAAAFGFDFTRGRLDRTVHPFATGFSRNDVRITTRYDPNFLNPSLFSTLHEAGHGMYEQGIGETLDGTMLGNGASLGVHESQSRLWENIVGRGRDTWQHFYPRLQETFPEQLGNVDLDTFYGAINRVHPSLIRVEADEVTYNLHIMLRFEMERELLDGKLAVEDAPEAWNEKMRAYLGITPPNDAEGVLQDVHWSGGMMGYFPTYSIGTILSAQLFDAAMRAHPNIPEEMRSGRFDTLHGWLVENVYRHGRKFEPNELITRATGEPLQSRSYVVYLKGKFGELYGLNS
ncbi:MAG TPA: carboxypeptidase M32 [Chloroflexota bacterium]|nr:carboxypeptidase M32 [Chloroflexota bacterium]